MKTSAELLSELRAVGGIRVAGVGDNVLDCYVDENLCYPGGNALNIAAYNSLLFGGHSAFIGILGNDRFAQHLRTSLAAIGVDDHRSRIVKGANGMAFVKIDSEGDRRFIGSNRGGVQSELRLRIAPADLDFLRGFDVVHTSVYSSLDESIAPLADSAEVSFDFSTDTRSTVVDSVANFVSMGFFSGDGLSEAEVSALGEYAVSRGIGRAVVTLGGRGAIAFDSHGSTSVGIVETHVVDTLGAGDAFITGFIAARAGGGELDECLRIASAAGAYACTTRGAFGYAVEAGDDAMAQLINYREAV